MSTSPLTFRLARPDEGPAVAAFLDAHWGEKHPLVHLPDFFDFYYRPFGPDGPLQFAFAEQDGAPVAIVGYIRANALETPDIWVSIWCAVKGHNGSGLELMAALPGLTNARVMACNNIRPRTMAFYTFLGYTAERLPHYYRLADKASYAVARVVRRDILPAGGSAVLRLLPDEDALCEMDDITKRLTQAGGYARYEVSNYAKAGKMCRHNIVYWECLPYLGIGCAAHSDMDGKRFYNAEDFDAYLNHVPAQMEDAGGRTFERMMMGLRMVRGVDERRFIRDFGCAPEDVWRQSLPRLMREGMIARADGRLCLTARGMQVMNAVLVEMMEEEG